MFLQLLVGMLRTQPGLEVVATAATAAEGIAACLSHRPDLLILDLALPDGSGAVVAEALAAVKPQARLIVLSAQASSFFCPPGLESMLHAVVDKIEAYDVLGEEIAELVGPHPPAAVLTAREAEVLRLLGQGLSNQQIADQLDLSPLTVQTHRRNLSAKLGMKGAELVRFAALQNLRHNRTL